MSRCVRACLRDCVLTYLFACLFACSLVCLFACLHPYIMLRYMRILDNLLIPSNLFTVPTPPPLFYSPRSGTLANTTRPCNYSASPSCPPSSTSPNPPSRLRCNPIHCYPPVQAPHYSTFHHSLSIQHPINTFYQHTLSTNAMNPPFQTPY